MCEAKPGVRCAADTGADALVKVGRYGQTHPQGPDVDPLSEAQAYFIASNPDVEISVPNPDDPMDMPIYEGPARGAGEMLVAGEYEAVLLHNPDAAPLVLSVPEHVAAPGDRVHSPTRGNGTILQSGGGLASGEAIQVQWDTLDPQTVSNGPRWEDPQTLRMGETPVEEGTAAAAVAAVLREAPQGVDSDFNADAQYATIAGEWAPDAKTRAVTFPDTTQGSGEPVYWVPTASMRKLHEGGLGAKEHFDAGWSDSYITFEHGHPVEHSRDEGGALTVRPLAFRDHGGQRLYSLEGYNLDSLDEQ